MASASAAGAKPKLFGDFISGPFRGCLVFARAAGIDVDVVQVRLNRGDHQKPAYLALNPLGKVPCLQDGELVVVESPTIMRYLCETRPVADHWLPRDPRRRARLNSALDWYLNTFNVGGAVVLQNKVLLASMGAKGNEQLVADYGMPLLTASLKALEDVWLGGGCAAFVGGGAQPSIADVLIACTLDMLRLIDAADSGPTYEELMVQYPAVRAWRERVAAACAPHYEEANAVLDKLRGAMLANMQRALKARSRL